jgi:siroheme synthase
LGAGPGDPDLLTVKAHRLLSDKKNLVIVDRLVSEEILAVVKGEVKRANKYPGCAEQVCCLHLCDCINYTFYCCACTLFANNECVGI